MLSKNDDRVCVVSMGVVTIGNIIIFGWVWQCYWWVEHIEMGVAMRDYDNYFC